MSQYAMFRCLLLPRLVTDAPALESCFGVFGVLCLVDPFHSVWKGLKTKWGEFRHEQYDRNVKHYRT